MPACSNVGTSGRLGDAFAVDLRQQKQRASL